MLLASGCVVRRMLSRHETPNAVCGSVVLQGVGPYCILASFVFVCIEHYCLGHLGVGL